MASMNYKVCILAAGRGTRVAQSKDFVKGLLPVGNVPTIHKLLTRLPQVCEIVIAVGHCSHLYREFFQHCFTDRKVTFVDVEPYSGPGSGPGYSLLSCKEHLDGPFYL